MCAPREAWSGALGRRSALCPGGDRWPCRWLRGAAAARHGDGVQGAGEASAALLERLQARDAELAEGVTANGLDAMSPGACGASALRIDEERTGKG